MDFKQRCLHQLTMSRDLSDKYLASFETPEQWTHQVSEGTNHALWFAGHIAVADNYFISLTAPDQAIDLASYNEQFGKGSRPSPNAADYPPPAEILEVLRERRAVLREVLNAQSEEDLDKPAPEGAPPFLADVGAIFQMAGWHEALHAGQLSLVRRSLGNSPLVGG
jgi:hypothetical protein